MSNRLFRITFLCSFILFALLCFTLSGCHSSNTADISSKASSSVSEHSYTQDLFAMDTTMTLTAYGDTAEEAVSSAIVEIQRLDDLFSTNKETSCVSQLNTNHAAQFSSDAISVLQTARTLYHDTDGAFNIALYPIVKAWGFTTEDYQIPSAETLQTLLHHIDADTIQLDAKSGAVTISDPQTEIDLGGIVKGYTSDQVLNTMQSKGISSAVISLGGNVQTLGTKPDGSLWRVGIQDPNDTEQVLCMVEVADKAVITSGPYQRYFIGEDGVRYHHIMDPETGRPAENGLSSVTIVSDSGILADGLSTALFVMGPEKALQYWKQHAEEFDAVLITENQDIIVTKGLSDSFQSDQDYYLYDGETQS